MPRAGRIRLPDHVRVCLFDMDGVLTDMATVQAEAWRRMFDEFLRAPSGTARRSFPWIPPATMAPTSTGTRAAPSGTHSCSSRPNFELYRKQVVKQADLVLALYLRGDAFTDEQKAADVAYTSTSPMPTSQRPHSWISATPATTHATASTSPPSRNVARRGRRLRWHARPRLLAQLERLALRLCDRRRCLRVEIHPEHAVYELLAERLKSPVLLRASVGEP